MGILNRKPKKTNNIKTNIKHAIENGKNVDYDLIIAIINRGYADYVVDASRDAGATGATIIYGRGVTGPKDESILGINLQPEKELILILVERQDKTKVMQSIIERTNINEDHKGLCFSIPVSTVSGLRLIEKTNKEEELAHMKATLTETTIKKTSKPKTTTANATSTKSTKTTTKKSTK